MSKHRDSGITRAEAEKLLDTGVGGPEALSALISAAVPPAAAGELVGEHAALMHFRAAHLTNVPSHRRTVMLKAAFANLLAAKVAAATAVAAAATGGLALAAATGNLPGTLQDTAHSAFGAPAASAATDSAGPSDEPSETLAPSDTGVPTSEAPESSEAAQPSGSASPSPSLTGLCKAFQAGATTNPGKALANPAFSVLVAAAGGTDKVADYCVTLVGPAPTRSHGVPTHPAGDASTHAGDRTTAHPTGAPVTHPAGEPTELPTHP